MSDHRLRQCPTCGGAFRNCPCIGLIDAKAAAREILKRATTVRAYSGENMVVSVLAAQAICQALLGEPAK